MDKNIILQDVDEPVVVSMNNKNRDIYFEKINLILLENNFSLIANFGVGWDNYLYDTRKVNLSFNKLKNILKKEFLDLEFQTNTYSRSNVPKTDLNLKPYEKNETLFEVFEIWCPFKKGN